MNQAERTCPVRARTCTLGNTSNFSGFQLIASLQLRNLGRAGVEEDVAVWWPVMLRISSERYVVRPERSGESAASPKLAAPAWRMPPRSGLKYTKIPAVGVEGMWKCCQSQCCQFSFGVRRGTRRQEGSFPSQRPRGSAALPTRLAEDGSPHRRQDGGSPCGRAGARPSPSV